MVAPREVPLEPRAGWRDVIRGRARFIGARTRIGRADLGLPAGVISPYELREATGLRYGDPPIEEARYERSRTTRSDASLLARYTLVHLLARSQRPRRAPRPRPRHRIVSAEVDACDTTEAVARILAWVRSGTSARVFFVHPHALNLAARDARLRQDLASASLVLPDGIGLRVAGRILGLAMPANVNGTDLVPELLLELAAHDVPIALIGGKPGVAERAADAWTKRTTVRVIGTWDGYRDEASYDAIAEEIASRGPCVVFLAFGSPLQERFATRHFTGRDGVVAITVGGLFDFAAGDKPRAPLAWRELGLEWAWRVVHEPKRLAKRYFLGNPEFVARAAWQRIRGALDR